MSGFEEPDRLESLWAGEFGDQYVDRNIGADHGRRDFWVDQLARLAPRTVLEVGCNVGANLVWIADVLGAGNVTGVDVNAKALELLAERVPGVHAQHAKGRKLPFDDGSFDLVFTTGVLIHQDPGEVDATMAEIVRCSRRYVLCGEYYSDELIEVPYRGQSGALWKRDFGALYERLFPSLRLIDRGFLARGQGSWDDLTYWVFEKG